MKERETWSHSCMELSEEVTPYIQGVISVLSDFAYILLPLVLKMGGERSKAPS